MSAWEAPGATSEWYTPKYVFDALGCRFDIDVAAPINGPLHVPTHRWLSSKALEHHWTGFVWMNPPFGGRNGLVPWLDKFFAHGNGIALVPDRTSAPWFRAAFERADLALFTRKIRFLRPDGTEGKSPSCGTALLASGETGCEALIRASSRGLGFLASPAKHLPHARALPDGNAPSDADFRALGLAHAHSTTSFQERNNG